MLPTIILLISTFMLHMVDYAQTLYAIQLVGLHVEANPIARFLFEHNCAWVAKFIVLPVLLTILGFLVKADKKLAFVPCLLFLWCFAFMIHNFVMLDRMGILEPAWLASPVFIGCAIIIGICSILIGVLCRLFKK